MTSTIFGKQGTKALLADYLLPSVGIAVLMLYIILIRRWLQYDEYV